MGKPSKAQQARRNRQQRRNYTSDLPPGSEPVRNPLDGVEFTIDGEVFACLGEVTVLDASELAAAAMAGLDYRSPAGLSMIAQFLGTAFGPVEYLRLKSHVREHGTPPEVLVQIMAEISAALEEFTIGATGRPTMPQPSSSPGQPDRADQMSRVISLHGDVTVVPEAELRARAEAAGQAVPTT